MKAKVLKARSVESPLLVPNAKGLLDTISHSQQPSQKSAPIVTTHSDFHNCYAVMASGFRCTVLVPKNMLMCGEHWKMVPKKLQESIYKNYTGKLNAAHSAACNAAREAVKKVLLSQENERAKYSCPFCLDKGRDEDKPDKYCICDAGRALIAKEKFRNKTPSLKKGEREYTAFPFGKHQGVPLTEVPIDYLQWFYENGEDRHDGLFTSVEIALYNRVSEIKT